MKIVVKNSPNQSQRTAGPVRIIVCHTPEGDSYPGMVSFLCSPKAEVSYHRLYKIDGTEATQLVPWDRKAWHALTYNSISDGLSVMGRARTFDLSQPGVKQLARGVAERCKARGVPAQWTTDPRKGGFCRHADLQNNRSDPTADLAEWKTFVGMVQAYHDGMTGGSSWPVPVPQWFWDWALWRRRGRTGPRPIAAPRVVPVWAWRRYAAMGGDHPA